jgi:hypothetical protein
MHFPLELEVQVVAAAQSGHTPELIERRLAAIAGRDDEESRRERAFLVGLKEREQLR